jgi:hypothetical protein
MGKFKFYYSPTEFVELDNNKTTDDIKRDFKLKSGKEWFEIGRYDKTQHADGSVTYFNDKCFDNNISKEEYEAHWKMKLLVEVIKEL